MSPRGRQSSVERAALYALAGVLVALPSRVRKALGHRIAAIPTLRDGRLRLDDFLYLAVAKAVLELEATGAITFHDMTKAAKVPRRRRQPSPGRSA
jgi:hypothetical protein